jgi:hypothetical protein
MIDLLARVRTGSKAFKFAELVKALRPAKTNVAARTPSC